MSGRADIPSQPDPGDATRHLWVVKRQDDNGNVFVVGSYPTQSEAERVRAEYEARGHRQEYWIEPAEADAD